ncbi:MAG: hypothetical protein HYY30_14715 [Chloroflexi bacterium]|nr:hypothetical protein [Chloroflexota bacterium]
MAQGNSVVKWIFWFFAISLTFLAGRLSSEFFKWLVVMGSAPTAEAKGIMVGYLISAAMPVLLLGVPAVLCWSWLLRSRYRNEAIAFLVLELAFTAFQVYGDVQAGASILLQR